MQGWYDDQPPSEVLPAALNAAASALRLEPRNVSAVATTAYATLYYKWELRGAKRASLKAIEADSNSVIARQWYGNYLTIARRWDEAESNFGWRSVSNEPLPSGMCAGVGASPSRRLCSRRRPLPQGGAVRLLLRHNL